MGGENSIEETTGALSAGSSPRGRGKRSKVRRLANQVRLIPAWAGKTVGGDRDAAGAGAHPRVGGENLDKKGLE